MMTSAAEKQQNNSNNEKEKRFCRLCHGTDDDAEQLCGIDQEWVHPCKCSGTLKWVHRGCFKAWHDQASYQQRTQCSLCSYVFRFSPRLKPRWYTEFDVGHWPYIWLDVVSIIWLLFYIASLDFLGIFRYAIMLGLFVELEMVKMAMQLWKLIKMEYRLQLQQLEIYKNDLQLFAMKRELFELTGEQQYNTGGLAAPTNSSVFEQSIENAV